MIHNNLLSILILIHPYNSSNFFLSLYLFLSFYIYLARSLCRDHSTTLRHYQKNIKIHFQHSTFSYLQNQKKKLNSFTYTLLYIVSLTPTHAHTCLNVLHRKKMTSDGGPADLAAISERLQSINRVVRNTAAQTKTPAAAADAKSNEISPSSSAVAEDTKTAASEVSEEPLELTLDDDTTDENRDKRYFPIIFSNFFKTIFSTIFSFFFSPISHFHVRFSFVFLFVFVQMQIFELWTWRRWWWLRWLRKLFIRYHSCKYIQLKSSCP